MVAPIHSNGSDESNRVKARNQSGPPLLMGSRNCVSARKGPQKCSRRQWLRRLSRLPSSASRRRPPPQALAIGNDNGVTTVNGNGAEQAYGNAKTAGDMSPQLTLAQGSLNKLCLGVPVKANAASLVGVLVPVTVLQDVPILSAPQNQQCTENSTQARATSRCRTSPTTSRCCRATAPSAADDRTPESDPGGPPDFPCGSPGPLNKAVFPLKRTVSALLRPSCQFGADDRVNCQVTRVLEFLPASIPRFTGCRSWWA